jgi:hypothetical protein
MSEELFKQVISPNLKELVEGTRELFKNIRSTKDIFANIRLIVTIVLRIIIEIERAQQGIKRKLTGEEKHDLAMFILRLLIKVPIWSVWVANPVLSTIISVSVQVLNVLFNNEWRDSVTVEQTNDPTENNVK